MSKAGWVKSKVDYKEIFSQLNPFQFEAVLIWRQASPLGSASQSKRAGFHLAFSWKFSGDCSRAGSSAHTFWEGELF